MLANDTWELVILLRGKKIIANSWVFVVKLKLDKQLERNKSWIAPKAYEQVEGLD